MVTVLPLIKVFEPIKKFPTREEPFSFDQEYTRFKEVFGIKTTKSQSKKKKGTTRSTKKRKDKPLI